MRRARRRLYLFQLHALLGSPLLLAICAVAMPAAVVVVRALGALREAASIRLDLETSAAHVAADAAAIDYVVSSGRSVHRAVDAGGGIEVTTSAAPGDAANGVQLLAQVGGLQLGFEFPLLPGATPPVLGVPFAMAEGAPPLPAGWPVPAFAAAADLPRVRADLDGVGAGARNDESFVRDQGIALLRLAAGTDREDYVLAGGDAAVRMHVPPSGTLTVRGNLWVDRGERPLRLELASDLTVIVIGNVYLGRTIQVEGPGRLTLASVVADGMPFADRDGNGRWSAGDVARMPGGFSGPLEGAGNVYLALPREGTGTIELDLGLVVGGELNVAAERAVVHGPLVLRFGATVLPGHRGALVPTGGRLPRLQRAVLPGFVATGRPCPGLLQRHATGRLPLYVAMPSR